MLEPARYEYDGHTHLDIGVHRLQQAIKATVIASGYPELALDPHPRALRRAIRKHLVDSHDDARAAAANDSSGAGAPEGG